MRRFPVSITITALAAAWLLAGCNKYQLIHVFLKGPDPRPVPIAFDTSQQEMQYTFLYPDTSQNDYLRQLKDRYQLQKLVQNSRTEEAAVLEVVQWTHRQWTHNGSNEPSRPDALTILAEAKEGRNFRCVEYATVLTDALLSLGYPARVVALKSRDAETCKTAAGHVLTEVFLKEKNKWALADAQFNVMPFLNGEPLSAVALQNAIIAQRQFDLVNAGGTKRGVAGRQYRNFIAPYLFFFETALDNRRLVNKASAGDGDKTHLMLVPRGVKPPSVFQRHFPIDYAHYTSSLHAFYSSPVLSPGPEKQGVAKAAE
jgi:hypothetical protein